MRSIQAPVILTRPFSPLQLPGLVAWYRADRGVFSDAGSTPATNNGTIQQWNDLSGHGYNLSQATAGNRPTFLSAGLNNLPAVSFTLATAQWMTTASGVGMGALNTLSCFAVCTMTTNTASSGRLITYCAAATNADFTGNGGGAVILQRNVTNSNINSTKAGTAVGMGGAVSIPLSTPVRVGVVYDGTLAYPYIDYGASSAKQARFVQAATSPTSITKATTTGGFIGVGHQLNAGGADGSAYWDGLLSEVFVTNQAMSPRDIDRLYRYFASWG